ncbi:MAG: hypothetical protein JWP74_3483 [Marmoricola sp.]|nr:hypothetical protein [Marmoricola sp.]
MSSKEHRQVERLAQRLLKFDLVNVDDLWRLQVDLLTLQHEIQKAISNVKALPKTKRDQTKLERLRSARWSSRQLGDAIAHVLLHNDRQFISAHSENDSVPIGKRDRGMDGVIAIAEGLSNKGWGFPLLHDITDCLRIGDVTFIRRGREPEYVTIEVKTKVLRETPHDDGMTEVQAQIMVLTQRNIDPDTGLPLSEQRDFSIDVANPPPINRIQRQADRMRQALIKGTASNGLIEGLEQPTLNLTVTLSTKSHWKTLRRLIRQSRSAGWAGALVDDGFYYLVVYSTEPFDSKVLEETDILATIVGRFSQSKVVEERAVILMLVPDRETTHTRAHLPYFLYNIPRRAVFDILHDRLQILVVVNPGHICDRLRDEGIEVDVRPQKTGPSDIVTVSTHEVDGVVYRSESHQFPAFLADTVAEFHSMDYLVGMVKGTQRAAEVHLPEYAHQVLGHTRETSKHL